MLCVMFFYCSASFEVADVYIHHIFQVSLYMCSHVYLFKIVVLLSIVDTCYWFVVFTLVCDVH